MSELTLDLAKAIMAKAIEHGAWSRDDPNNVTDEDELRDAGNVLSAAKDAADRGSVNTAVLEILAVAGVEASAPTAAPAAAPPSQPAPGGAFAQPPAAPAEPQSATQSALAPSSAPTAEEINAIFGGMAYDDLKAAQIKAAVIDAAASGELTPEEWAQIKAYEDREGGEQRKTILSLEPEFKTPEPEPTGAFGQLPSASAAGVTQHAGGGAPADEGEGLGAFYNGETISRAQQEGLPIPPQPSVDQTQIVMPIDITVTGDAELSRLATIYHSLFARAQWLISQEEGRERAAEQLEHDAHRDSYVSAYENHKSAIPEGKSGPTALDAARKLAEKDADNAQPVHAWRTRRIRHGNDARELKALSTGYDKAVWRINEELERRARLATSSVAAR